MAKKKLTVDINITMADPNRSPNRDLLFGNNAIFQENLNLLKKTYIDNLVTFNKEWAETVQYLISNLITNQEAWKKDQEEKAPSVVKEVVDEIIKE